MMSVANKKIKLSTLLFAVILTTNFVFADAYKNNVVDVKVNKEAGNAVKVTIYTDKPYTEPVVVNKKANNKYVILMPETKSALKCAPTVSSSDGTVSNVSVNTQDVAGGKGYTKIVITTDRAITIVPRTQQLRANTPLAAVKPAVSKPTSTVSKPIAQSTQKSAQQKAAEEKAKKLAQQKAALEKQKQEQAKKAQLAAQQKAKEDAAKKAEQQAKSQQKIAEVDKQQPIEVLENEINTGKSANISNSNGDEILNKEINKNLAKKEESAKKQKSFGINESKQSLVSGLKNVKTLIQNQNLSLWKLLLLAGAITFPIIVVMLILGLDKKINKKIENSFKKEEDYVSESNVSSDESSENINPIPVYGSFDEALSDTTAQVQEQMPEAQDKVENIDTVQPVGVVSGEETFNNDFVDEDFEHDFDTENEVQVPDVIEAADETEVVPPVTGVVGNSAESETESTEEISAPAQPYNPDGYLSDFSGVSDEDFFDELVLQTMAEQNSDGLPNELPADEIFKFMSEDEPAESAGSAELSENALSGDVKSDVEANTLTSDVAVQGDNDLTMLTEVKINDKTGLYLVNYDNFSSLVGHIDDDYFVIKKFNDIVNGNIILKPTEQLDNATRYLVRVGKSKMVVEVSDTSMSKLIDL